MFIALERLINLQEGYRQTFQVNGQQLLLLVQDAQPLLFAVGQADGLAAIALVYEGDRVGIDV